MAKQLRARPEDLWDQPDHFKKKVAFYGGGHTRTLLLDHPLVDDDCEIWSGNHVWNFTDELPRELDRCFEIHDIGLLEHYPGEGDKKHFRWLQEEHPFPIYMQEVDPRFPSAVRYPYQEVSREIFGKVYRGTQQKEAFGSTIDFMAALAVYEGFDWIGYFGIEMGSSTEYLYQLPDGQLHIGYAAGRDITVWVPDDPRCKLLGRQVYGYEGWQMVSRQTLGKAYKTFEAQRRKWLAAQQTFVGAYREIEGRIIEARENGGVDPEEEAKARHVGQQLREAREAAAMVSGCMLATKWFIEFCDGYMPDLKVDMGMFDELPMEDEV